MLRVVEGVRSGLFEFWFPHAVFERSSRIAMETWLVCLSASLPERSERLVEFSGELFASMKRRPSGAEPGGAREGWSWLVSAG
ncbi:MAG: hypothetical protein ABSG43_15905 [Solirubrobacteraceae bacterium]